MQHVLRLLETRDSVQVAELAETFSVSEVTVRSDLSDARPPGPRRARPRRRAGPRSDGRRGRVRPAAAARGRAEARDRPRSGRDGGRRRGGRARRQHDRLLPRARAALEARARRRDERPARRDGARRRSGHHRARHRRRAAAVRDVPRRRPRHGRAAVDADQQGLPRRARPQPRARADGPQPGRGADQAGDGGRLRAGVRHLRRHEVAPQRAAVVRPGRGPRGRRHRLGAPADQVEAWRAAGLEVVVADPGPHESVPARPRDLRRVPGPERAAGG